MFSFGLLRVWQSVCPRYNKHSSNPEFSCHVRMNLHLVKCLRMLSDLDNFKMMKLIKWENLFCKNLINIKSWRCKTKWNISEHCMDPFWSLDTLFNCTLLIFSGKLMVCHHLQIDINTGLKSTEMFEYCSTKTNEHMCVLHSLWNIHVKKKL